MKTNLISIFPVLLQTKDKSNIKKVGSRFYFNNNDIEIFDAYYHLYFITLIKSQSPSLSKYPPIRYGYYYYSVSTETIQRVISDDNNFLPTSETGAFIVIASTDNNIFNNGFLSHQQQIIFKISDTDVKKYLDSVNICEHYGDFTTELIEYDGQCMKTLCDDRCSYPHCYSHGWVVVKHNKNDEVIIDEV